MNIDIFTLFPGWFRWFLEQRHVSNALAHGHEVTPVDLRATTPLKAGQVDDTPYGGGAGMVIRVDVVEAALRARYGADPMELPARRRVVALAAGGRQLDERLARELAAGRRSPSFRAYKGSTRHVHEHLASDLDSTRPVRPGRWWLAAMVLCERRHSQAAGALGHADSAWRVLGESASRGARVTPTTRGHSTGGVKGCPRSWSPATTLA